MKFNDMVKARRGANHISKDTLGVEVPEYVVVEAKGISIGFYIVDRQDKGESGEIITYVANAGPTFDQDYPIDVYVDIKIKRGEYTGEPVLNYRMTWYSQDNNDGWWSDGQKTIEEILHDGWDQAIPRCRSDRLYC